MCGAPQPPPMCQEGKESAREKGRLEDVGGNAPTTITSFRRCRFDSLFASCFRNRAFSATMTVSPSLLAAIRSNRTQARRSCGERIGGSGARGRLSESVFSRASSSPSRLRVQSKSFWSTPIKRAKRPDAAPLRGLSPGGRSSMDVLTRSTGCDGSRSGFVLCFREGPGLRRAGVFCLHFENFASSEPQERASSHPPHAPSTQKPTTTPSIQVPDQRDVQIPVAASRLQVSGSKRKRGAPARERGRE